MPGSTAIQVHAQGQGDGHTQGQDQLSLQTIQGLFNSVAGGAAYKKPEANYWRPKSKNAQVDKSIINWTNKAIMKTPRLLQIKGTGKGGKMVMREVEKRVDSLNAGDVFILDTGNLLYIWHGAKANQAEKDIALQVVQNICASRGMNTHHTILEQAKGHDDCVNFWKELQRRPTIFGFENKFCHKFKVRSAEQGGTDSDIEQITMRLYPIDKNGRRRKWKPKKLSSVEVDGTVVEDQYFARKKLDSNKAFLLNDGFTIWIWIGKSANISQSYACKQAVKYLYEKTNHSWLKRNHNIPASLPIIIAKEDQEPEAFWKNFKHIRKSRLLGR